MVINNISRKGMEQLLDFSQFSIRTLELYDCVQSSVTRQLLVDELHNRLRRMNGDSETKLFQVFLTPFSRLINELQGHPENIEAGIELAEEMMAAIERALIAQVYKVA